MDRLEVSVLLALIAARDGRTVGAVEVEAWFEDVGDYDFATARQAVHRHYTATRDYLRPFDLLQAIRAIYAERLAAAGPIVPPLEPADHPVAEQAWIRRRRHAIATASDKAVPAVLDPALLSGSERPGAISRIRALAGVPVVAMYPRQKRPGVPQGASECTCDAEAVRTVESARQAQLAALRVLIDDERAAS